MISRRHPLAVRLNLGGWIAYWSDLRLRLYGWRDPAIRSTAALAAAASFTLDHQHPHLALLLSRTASLYRPS